MKFFASALFGLLLYPGIGSAQTSVDYPVAKVSFDAYKNLVSYVEAHRAKHLIDLETFLKMSVEPNVLILDTRSEFRYKRIHLQGAKHLNFSDFTQDNLAKLIPNRNTKILIYCNNNFRGNEVDFASKIAPPLRSFPLPTSSTTDSSPVEAQLKVQEKPMMMALNVPTYINLFGYGYHNVYELHELVDVNDPRITFEGSIVEP